MKKQYIGDGVYVEISPIDGSLLLTTENGLIETNRIFLDPSVWESLKLFVESFKGKF